MKKRRKSETATPWKLQQKEARRAKRRDRALAAETRRSERRHLAMFAGRGYAAP